jgi:hypothetical protein
VGLGDWAWTGIRIGIVIVNAHRRR